MRSGQAWFIERMKKFYQSDERGICFGLSHMATQAILTNGVETLNNRLIMLKNIDPDKLVAMAEQEKKDRIQLVAQVKAAVLQEIKMKIQMQQTQENKNNLELKEIKTFEDLNANEKKEFFETVTKKMNEQHGNDDKTDKINMLDLLAFFEGIELYHSPFRYLELFPGKPDVHKAQKMNEGHAASLLAPDSLKEIKEAAAFTGVYNSKELEKLFSSFSEALEEKKSPCTYPVAFKLFGIRHVISIGYDPKDKSWTYIDANHLPPEKIKDISLLSNKVLQAFSKNNDAAFATRIYTTTDNENDLKSKMDALKKQTAWKELHPDTPEQIREKASRQDSESGNWIYVAAQNGDIAYPKTLAAMSRNLDLSRKDGITPLLLAARDGHADFVKDLLENKADPNLKTENGNYAISWAARCGYTDIVKILLAHGANPNLTDGESKTPLQQASGQDHKSTVDVITAFTTHALYPLYENFYQAQALLTKGEYIEARKLLAELDSKTILQSPSQEELIFKTKIKAEIELVDEAQKLMKAYFLINNIEMKEDDRKKLFIEVKQKLQSKFSPADIIYEKMNFQFNENSAKNLLKALQDDKFKAQIKSMDGGDYFNSLQNKINVELGKKKYQEGLREYKIILKNQAAKARVLFQESFKFLGDSPSESKKIKEIILDLGQKFMLMGREHYEKSDLSSLRLAKTLFLDALKIFPNSSAESKEIKELLKNVAVKCADTAANYCLNPKLKYEGEILKKIAAEISTVLQELENKSSMTISTDSSGTARPSNLCSTSKIATMIPVIQSPADNVVVRKVEVKDIPDEKPIPIQDSIPDGSALDLTQTVTDGSKSFRPR